MVDGNWIFAPNISANRRFAALHPGVAGNVGKGWPFLDAATAWDPYSPQATVTALRFWHRVLVQYPPDAGAPGWDTLLGASRTPAAVRGPQARDAPLAGEPSST